MSIPTKGFFPIAALAIGIMGMSTAVLGQNLSIGVLGGFSPGDDFQTKLPAQSPSASNIRSSGSNGYLAGPSVEFRLRSGFSLEVDALYRALHFADSPGTVVTWQFPVLTKYRFSLGPLKPFVEAGPSFRTQGNLNGTEPSNYGGTAGLGVEFYVRSLRIAPTLRYTRWAQDDNQFGALTNPNRVEVLLGVSRATESNWHPLGDRVSIGVVAGATLTDDFRSTTYTGNDLLSGTTSTFIYHSGPKSFIVGPAAEIKIGKGLSMEANAIYRPLRDAGTVTSAGNLLLPSSSSKRVTWEFPVLAKYKFAVRGVRPFVEMGPSFRTPQEVNGARLSTHGITTGVGVEARFGRLRIAPAVRYTHWAPDSAQGRSLALRNQAALLVGFTF